MLVWEDDPRPVSTNVPRTAPEQALGSARTPLSPASVMAPAAQPSLASAVPAQAAPATTLHTAAAHVARAASSVVASHERRVNEIGRAHV